MTAVARPLYAIAAELDTIGDALYESEGVMTPEIQAQLDALAGEFDDKAERVGLYIKNAGAMHKAVQEERRALAERETRLDATVKRLKDYLKAQMEIVGRSKLETPRIVLRIQANSVPSVTCDVEPEALPEEYRTIIVSVNKQALTEAFKAGKELPVGVTVERGSHLRVN